MALGVAIYFLYLYIWIFPRGSSGGFPAARPVGLLLHSTKKTKNEHFLSELAVAFNDGLINKLLCDGAGTSVRGTYYLWNNFHLLSGFDADIPNGCLRHHDLYALAALSFTILLKPH